MKTALIIGALVLAAVTFAATRRGGPDEPVSAADTGAAARPLQRGVVGTVVDPSGQPVSGALVSAESLDGAPVPELGVMTDAEGRYAWPLQPGRYRITVTAEGHRRAGAAFVSVPALATGDRA